jgi:hypothetical protein
MGSNRGTLEIFRGAVKTLIALACRESAAQAVPSLINHAARVPFLLGNAGFFCARRGTGRLDRHLSEALSDSEPWYIETQLPGS